MATRKRTQRDAYKGKTGEAAGRQRGYDDKGGKPGADLLEDGQLRGVDEEGRIVTGTHQGPQKSRSAGKKRPRTPAHAR